MEEKKKKDSAFSILVFGQVTIMSIVIMVIKMIQEMALLMRTTMLFIYGNYQNDDLVLLKGENYQDCEDCNYEHYNDFDFDNSQDFVDYNHE